MHSSLIQQFLQIDELLKSAKRVLIVSHETPDADAVGSVLAVQSAFKNLETFCYLPDQPSKNLNFLPGFFKIDNKIPQTFLNPDIIFCLDYGDFERLRLPSLISAKIIVTIDHHQGDQTGQIKIIRPDFSSTSEIVYSFFKEIGVKVNKEIATCLLTGIIADSGGFSHAATSSQTMEIASRLLLAGAPITKIARRVLSLNQPSSNHIDILRIWGKALSRIKDDEKTRLAYSWLTFEDLKESQASFLDLAGISSIVSTITSADMTLFLVEYEKGKIKGSLRSEPFKGNGKGVIALAKALGGGGHPYAAGFKQKGTIADALKKVLNLIE